MIEAIQPATAVSMEAAFNPSLKNSAVALATAPKDSKTRARTEPSPSLAPHPFPTFAATPKKEKD